LPEQKSADFKKPEFGRISNSPPGLATTYIHTDNFIFLPK